MRYLTIINDIVNVQRQDIIERIFRGHCGRTWSPLGIRGHCKKNGDNRINGKISDFTMPHIQGEGQHANEVLPAKKKWFFGSIIDRNCKETLALLLTS